MLIISVNKRVKVNKQVGQKNDPLKAGYKRVMAIVDGRTRHLDIKKD